jgi:methyltransferase (TIGR00027 family)
MVKLLQVLVFLPIQVLFLPLVILGGVLATFQEMVVSRIMGVSFTAGQAIHPRWIMHYMNTRKDPDTVAFIKALPMESHFGLMGCMSATFLANRICGFAPSFAKMPEPGKESLLNFIFPRTVHFDRLVEENLARVDQVVILGGGYDLRILKLSRGKQVSVFELDAEKTQAMKLSTLKRAGIAHDWVTYIPMDFRQEDWVEKLLEKGFDPAKRTLFHWESVSCYLEEAVVADSLKKMSDLCVDGSVITQDFYAQHFLAGGLSLLAWVMGEPFLSGIDMSEAAEKEIKTLLKAAGLELKSLILCGQERRDARPFYAITEAVKNSASPTRS